jgi:Fur family peroxide stress response transcriptional regulator
MSLSTTKARRSKYCDLITLVIKELGHATNAQIAALVRRKYPSVSDTTVHRATDRLASRGELGIAPPDVNGAKRFDANTQDHDHFMCLDCGRLHDLVVDKALKDDVNSRIGNCSVDGQLTIQGQCSKCHTAR